MSNATAQLAIALALALVAGRAGAEEAEAEDPAEDEAETGAETGAEAEATTEAGAEEAAAERRRDLTHRFQGGLGAVIGTGYYFELPWGGGECTQTVEGEPTAASSCSGMSPLYLGIQGSFGVAAGLELLVELRLGLLEQYLQTSSCPEGVPCPAIEAQERTRPLAMGLGVRYYTDPTSWFKFFVGALVDVDFTPTLAVDVTVRPIAGVQFDVVRWFGVYLQVAPTISFIRSLRFAFDGGLGLQARFP